MSYNCERCHDTGSLSKDIDGSLDCACCGVADERLALEKWALEEKLDVSVGALWRIREHVVAAQPAGALNDHGMRLVHSVCNNLILSGNGQAGDYIRALYGITINTDVPAHPAGAPSIDTPQFQDLAEYWRKEPYGTRSFENAWAELIAHIDVKLARQGAAPAQAEPVATYQGQVFSDRGSNVWHDLKEAAYRAFPAEHRRILYATAPAHAGVAQAEAPNDDTELLDFLERCVMRDGKSVNAEREHNGTRGSATYGDLPTVLLFSVPSQHVRGVGFRGAVRAAIQASSKQSDVY